MITEDSMNGSNAENGVDYLEGDGGGANKSEAERVLKVIETIKMEGLKGIGNFIVLALSLEDTRVKRHISPIYQTKGQAFKILEILLTSCMRERRQTGKYIQILREKMGSVIRDIFGDIVNFELKDVMQDKNVNRLPSSLNTDTASDFAFSNFQKVFEEKAPFTWSMLCELCGVGHDGSGAQTQEEHDDDDDEKEEEEEEGIEEREQEEGSNSDNVRRLSYTDKEGPARNKRVVDRYLRATTIFAMIMNSQNFKVNYFQTMVSVPCYMKTVRSMEFVVNKFGI